MYRKTAATKAPQGWIAWWGTPFLIALAGAGTFGGFLLVYLSVNAPQKKPVDPPAAVKKEEPKP